MISLSLRQLVQFYQGWAEKEVQRGKLAPGTLAYYVRHHQAFLDHCGDVGIDQLVAFHLLQFGDSWHEIQAIQRLFNWARDTAGLIEHHPFGKVKKPPLGERKRILTRHESVRLFRASNRMFRQCLFFARESIARPQEVRGLLWDDLYQLGNGVQYFSPFEFKGKKRRKDKNAVRIIPVTPRLSRLLDRIRRKMLLPVGPIFLNTKGRPWSSNAIRCEMRTLRERLGFGTDRNGERVVFYTMRHTTATTLTELGFDLKLLSELMGHADPRMTNRYQHPRVAPTLAAHQNVLQSDKFAAFNQRGSIRGLIAGPKSSGSEP